MQVYIIKTYQLIVWSEDFRTIYVQKYFGTGRVQIFFL